MKRFGLIMAMGALLALTPLTACAGGLSGVITGVTTGTPAQANSVAAAENLYTLVAHAATGYVQNQKPTAETKAKIAAVDANVYAALVAARDAAQHGDSATIAIALNFFNTKYGSFVSLLTGLGVPVPTT